MICFHSLVFVPTVWHDQMLDTKEIKKKSLNDKIVFQLHKTQPQSDFKAKLEIKSLRPFFAWQRVRLKVLHKLTKMSLVP